MCTGVRLGSKVRYFGSVMDRNAPATSASGSIHGRRHSAWRLGSGSGQLGRPDAGLSPGRPLPAPVTSWYCVVTPRSFRGVRLCSCQRAFGAAVLPRRTYIFTLVFLRGRKYVPTPNLIGINIYRYLTLQT